MEKSIAITYLTCTYNRQSELKGLYRSLLNQTINNFVWMIIDDGSRDDTEQIVNQWINEKTIPIKYYKIKNGGKHRAINYAIPKLSTELVMVIDSDDWLVNDCSKIITNYWKKYKGKNKVAQMTFERGITIEKPLVKINQMTIAPRYDYIEKYWKYGDYNDVFMVSALKNFRLPEFRGEKFISEQPLYYYFSSKYNTLFVDKIIAVGDYRIDGLTRNIRKLQINNYQGTLYTLNLEVTRRTPFLSRLKHMVLYDYIAIKSKKKLSSAINESNNLLLCLFCLPISYLVVKANI